VRLEGLGKLKKNVMTLSGLEPATFRLEGPVEYTHFSYLYDLWAFMFVHLEHKPVVTKAVILLKIHRILSSNFFRYTHI
jgi:hypothetical protein